MGTFLNALRVEQISIKPKEWKLLAPLLFSSDVLGRLIEVPQDFVTDFASVPRIPFAYWLAGGVADAAAVVHDYLYGRPMEFPGLTKFEADFVFLEALIASEVPWWRRQLMYAAVRWFGRGTWSSKGGAR